MRELSSYITNIIAKVINIYNFNYNKLKYFVILDNITEFDSRISAIFKLIISHNIITRIPRKRSQNDLKKLKF